MSSSSKIFAYITMKINCSYSSKIQLIINSKYRQPIFFSSLNHPVQYTDSLLTTNLVKDEQRLGRHFSEQINLKTVTNFWICVLHYCDSEENQWESLIMFVNKVLTSYLIFLQRQNSAM